MSDETFGSAGGAKRPPQVMAAAIILWISFAIGCAYALQMGALGSAMALRFSAVFLLFTETARSWFAGMRL